MKFRTLGKTGFKVSEVSLGTWQLGGQWGTQFNESDATETLAEAYDKGVNFFDTADIYQDGASEHTVGQFLKQHPDVHYTTKIGRKDPLSVTSFNKEHLEQYVNESLSNLGVDSLDMVLLHCPPMSVYYMPETFFALDELKKAGKIQNYGVSVERVEEALKALSYDISAVEIIFNMFRLRPRDLFFDQAKKNNVGILARVPLASGLLTGKYDLDTKFPADDHRTTNRNGELFDKGETFSGVDYKTGVMAANELKQRLGTDNLAATALKFILMHDAISTVIPGASKPSQIERNTVASDLDELTPDQMAVVQDVYNKYIKNPVEYLW
ncbi:aldo/keto reductase [Lentilactobacillus sp. SPB1-3]|uniref:Aldo/keto reductase n=1 Tax=Lentilactobacillus terminaliae TaxID=3003483 RepID=A0ACD5DES6_9LACO|nr:aldo/keto reductase [Lentilactobacillus sp. SPB1-3]MCZ0976402.1 aldo/keto reductase [Lentilactobacillus sp. SPB1-3]